MHTSVVRTILFNAGYFTKVYGNIVVAWSILPVTIEQVTNDLAPWLVDGEVLPMFTAFGRVQIMCEEASNV